MGVYSILVLPRASEWQTEWRLATAPLAGEERSTFLKEEKGPPSPPKGSPAQNPAPRIMSHVGNSKPLMLGYLPPCPAPHLSPLPPSSTLPEAPGAGAQESPAIIQKTDRRAHCVLKS